VRLAAPRVVAVAGALLVVFGIVLVVRARGDAGGLMFLSPEQFELLQAAHRRADTGRVLLVVGVALLAVLGGWLLGRRRSSAGRSGVVVAVAVGVLGAALVVAGVLLLHAAGTVRVTAYSGSYESMGCSGRPDCVEPSGAAASGGARWGGLGSALVGGLLLGVSGGVTRGNRRADLG
jgi:hypothetical protein